jgi:hypothetical protein
MRSDRRSWRAVHLVQQSVAESNMVGSSPPTLLSMVGAVGMDWLAGPVVPRRDGLPSRVRASMIFIMQALDDEVVNVELPARLWGGIDATVDGVISMATVDGDTERAQIGRAIRGAGWAQVPWVDGEWPPMDQTINITLTRRQWQFAIEQVRDTIPIVESIDDQDSLVILQGAVAAVTPQLR